MSFTDDIKREMLSVWLKKPCCRLCEFYGLALFSCKKEDIVISSKNEELVKHFRSLLKKCFDLSCEIDEKSGKYSVFVKKNKLSSLDFSKISNDKFICDSCVGAFLRGAFLACGSCTDPQKEYDLYFNIATEHLAHEFFILLNSCGFSAKIKATRSSDKFCVYIKKSGDIEDILTLIGAQNATLRLMELKILKDVRNSVNRKTNFETANIKKSSQSCAKQLEAIKKLEDNGKLQTLPDELYDLAIARHENIDISLTELGKKFGLSRSGVHHRLQKIIELANEE